MIIHDSQYNKKVDIIFVTGDAYVDHPSNGVALLCRLLDSRGYDVAVIDQPDMDDISSIERYGTPRLFFAVTAGLVDSLVANYTPMKRKREKDRLGYEGSSRPDRATIAYVGAIKRMFKDTPIVIGGIEASLRRFSHYDYWQNKVRRSILLDSKADILVYGMGERQILEIATRCKEKRGLENIAGTVIRCTEVPKNAITLPEFDQVKRHKEKYMLSFEIQSTNQDPFTSPPLVEPYDGGRLIIQYPPSIPLSSEELDYVYEQPFTRLPLKTERGKAESTSPVEFSIVTHRGCFGACSFCALSMHQGRYIQSRSEESIMREARSFLSHPHFKGIIDDVGGPTANMYKMGCVKGDGTIGVKSIIDDSPIEMPIIGMGCERPCLYPACPNLSIDHRPLISLLKKLRSIVGIRHVFVRSGIRYDLALTDKNYLTEMCAHHISGQLKIAPEHVDNEVLRLMNKPPLQKFESFRELYADINKKMGKRQYIVPYMIAAHPGSTMKCARTLGFYLKKRKVALEQIQVFTPTPMTASTAMYHTGMEPFSRKPVFVPYTYNEKKKQKELALGKC